MTTETKNSLRKFWEKLGKPLVAKNHLHDTRIFRVAVYGPVILALGLATVGYVNSPVEADWTLKGFNNFVTLFKLPIGLASIAIPLAALVATHHRSIQAASQIKSQQSQNTFSNYIKHKEYFGKYLEDENLLNGETSFKALNKKVYAALFPFAADGDLEPNLFLHSEDIEHIEAMVSETVELAGKIVWNDQTCIKELATCIDNLRSEIQTFFYLEIVSPNYSVSVENLIHEINTIVNTLQHLSSASSFLDTYGEDENLGEWIFTLNKSTYPLKIVRNFEIAEERLIDIASSGARLGLVKLSRPQIIHLRELLGEESRQKVEFLLEKHKNNQRIIELLKAINSEL